MTRIYDDHSEQEFANEYDEEEEFSDDESDQEEELHDVGGV